MEIGVTPSGKKREGSKEANKQPVQPVDRESSRLVRNTSRLVPTKHSYGLVKMITVLFARFPWTWATSSDPDAWSCYNQASNLEDYLHTTNLYTPKFSSVSVQQSDQIRS